LEKTDEEIKNQALVFYKLMAERKFFPNTPCLVNAGKKHQQLSACFVLPIERFNGLNIGNDVEYGQIHKSGGGNGFFLQPAKALRRLYCNVGGDYGRAGVVYAGVQRCDGSN